MSYINWEYYSSLYSKVEQGTFEKLVLPAEHEVKMVIGYKRWNDIDETAFYFEQLKDCICKVINKIAGNDASGIGRGISSASNDGYSENYVIQTQEELQCELRGLIRIWLSGTGLVGAY